MNVEKEEMVDFISKIKDTYSLDEILLILAFTSMFLPWFIGVGVIVFLAVYLLMYRDFKAIIKEVKGSKVMGILCIYLLIVALLHHNWYGAVLSVFMMTMFINVLYFRRHINEKVFHTILEISIFLSIVCVIYGIFEQFYYMSEFRNMGFFDIQDRAQYRVHTFFYNANYYALVILYVECMCVYKFFVHKERKKRIYYTFVGLINILPMYLTGGRIVWIVFAFGITVMLIVKRWWKMLVVALGLEGLLAYLLKTFPMLLPRLALNGLHVERRLQIWRSAVLMIQDHGFFGGGLYAYFNLYKGYEKKYIEKYGLKSFREYISGIASEHSHSILTEPFLSFGLVGTCLFVGYLIPQVKSILHLITKHKDYALASFVIGCLAMAVGYCLMDFPIMWHQTGYLLMLILGCSEIYREDKVEC